MESECERSALAGGAVPSVAIIANTAGLTQEVADATKSTWLAKFAGPAARARRPPEWDDGRPARVVAVRTPQLTEARQMSLVDVANMFNIDGYWLGAPVSGMTYRTAGPQYQQILRRPWSRYSSISRTCGPTPGCRAAVDPFRPLPTALKDDMATTTTAVVALVGAGIITAEQAPDDPRRSRPSPAAAPSLSRCRTPAPSAAARTTTLADDPEEDDLPNDRYLPTRAHVLRPIHDPRRRGRGPLRASLRRCTGGPSPMTRGRRSSRSQSRRSASGTR